MSGYEINLTREASYPTPYANISLLMPLLTSLLDQRISPVTKDDFQSEYDYIIVGGGTAGSVVASRLSENECVNVLLLEYGGHPPILTEIPAQFAPWMGSDIDYKFLTTPVGNLCPSVPENRLLVNAGKVLGGSSTINGLLYIRGNHEDFDNWAHVGAKGWSYDDVLPYFKKSENNLNQEFVDSGYHGEDGPLTVSDLEYKDRMHYSIKKAVLDLGYSVVDSNGAKQTGFFLPQSTSRNGQRCSSAKAFLVPAENRTNLDIIINAYVKKVQIDGNPLKATGVIFDHRGQTHTVKARREVIVSAGLIKTPQLLMLSGLGPRQELEKHDIEVLQDLPVGQNYIDQTFTYMDYLIDSNIPTVNEKLADEDSVLNYIKNRTGPQTQASLATIIGFLEGDKIQPKKDFPNYQLYFTAENVKTYSNLVCNTKETYDKYYKRYENKPLLHCAVQSLRPWSRGSVTLNSTDPYDHPIIDPKYLSDPRDIDDLIQGMKTCHRIANYEPLRKDLDIREFEGLYPGCEQHEGDDDAYFRCYLEHIVNPALHGCCTARMGDAADPDAVVDPELRVKGVQGLRVADASVMPMVTSGNTMAPVYMIAEKAADMIKADLMKSIGNC